MIPIHSTLKSTFARDTTKWNLVKPATHNVWAVSVDNNASYSPQFVCLMLGVNRSNNSRTESTSLTRIYTRQRRPRSTSQKAKEFASIKIWRCRWNTELGPWGTSYSGCNYWEDDRGVSMLNITNTFTTIGRWCRTRQIEKGGLKTTSERLKLQSRKCDYIGITLICVHANYWSTIQLTPNKTKPARIGLLINVLQNFNNSFEIKPAGLSFHFLYLFSA